MHALTQPDILLFNPRIPPRSQQTQRDWIEKEAGKNFDQRNVPLRGLRGLKSGAPGLRVAGMTDSSAKIWNDNLLQKPINPSVYAENTGSAKSEKEIRLQSNYQHQ